MFTIKFSTFAIYTMILAAVDYLSDRDSKKLFSGILLAITLILLYIASQTNNLYCLFITMLIVLLNAADWDLILKKNIKKNYD
jgi:hypothetical protein